MNDRQCRYDPRSCQSLLGYGRATHAQSGSICAYCGVGKDRVEFDVWRQLSVDHVIPARLFPDEGRILQSVFPSLSKADLRKLGEKINGINLLTACNFCNSMTSRMKDISVDGILSPEGYEDVASINDESVDAMLHRLQEYVDKVLPIKQGYVSTRLAKLRKTFEGEVRPELRSARNRSGVKKEALAGIDSFEEQLRRCRAFLPRLDKSLVGHLAYQSPPFYENRGYKVAVVFPEPLT